MKIEFDNTVILPGEDWPHITKDNLSIENIKKAIEIILEPLRGEQMSTYVIDRVDYKIRDLINNYIDLEDFSAQELTKTLTNLRKYSFNFWRVNLETIDHNAKLARYAYNDDELIVNMPNVIAYLGFRITMELEKYQPKL